METRQPKLRFPEFKGDWGLYSLRDFIAKIESGWSPVCLTETVKEGEWGSLKTTSISWEGYFPNENKKLPINLEPRINTEVVIDDILITRVGPLNRVGVVAHVDKTWKHLMVSDNMFRLKLRGEIFPPFVPLILGSFNVQASWKRKIAGLASAQVVINQQTIFSTVLSLPLLQEQTRIANFISAVDDKINLLKEKKALLEEYKKGIMQKIFNQELRFKDDNGNDFGDWEEKTIAKICTKIQSGGTPKSTNKDYYDGNIPFLSIADMTKQGKYIEYTSNSISEYGLKNSSSWIVPVNSIIYSMYASVGFVAINKIPIATSQAVLNLILEQDICVDYIYYFLLDFQKYLAEYITTGTQGNLNAQTVKGFVVPIPSIEEQTKIANFLSAIDEKIALVATQIEDTQEYKKGLLQQLFV